MYGVSHKHRLLLGAGAIGSHLSLRSHFWPMYVPVYMSVDNKILQLI